MHLQNLKNTALQASVWIHGVILFLTWIQSDDTRTLLHASMWIYRAQHTAAWLLHLELPDLNWKNESCNLLILTGWLAGLMNVVLQPLIHYLVPALYPMELLGSTFACLHHMGRDRAGTHPGQVVSPSQSITGQLQTEQSAVWLLYKHIPSLGFVQW